MKSILLAIIVTISGFLGGSINSIDCSKLDNSHITEINGEKVEGIKVSDRYSNYENSIDMYTGEDAGVVIFYTDDLTDIRIIDNR